MRQINWLTDCLKESTPDVVSWCHAQQDNVRHWKDKNTHRLCIATKLFGMCNGWHKITIRQIHNINEFYHNGFFPLQSLIGVLHSSFHSRVESDSHLPSFCIARLIDWLTNSRHFVIQSGVKPKPLETHTSIFRRFACVGNICLLWLWTVRVVCNWTKWLFGPKSYNTHENSFRFFKTRKKKKNSKLTQVYFLLYPIISWSLFLGYTYFSLCEKKKSKTFAIEKNCIFSDFNITWPCEGAGVKNEIQVTLYM